MLVLLLEDEMTLAQLVVEYLEEEKIECDHATNGQQALQLMTNNQFDVLVLDINMPGLNGLQVCEKARKIGINTPIIMLTARDTLEDKLAGFSGGADDYLVKPFAMEELVARIHALSERRQRSDIIQIGDLCVYANEKKVQRNGTTLKLSPDEWRLMLLLARKSPDVVKKERIEDEVWPQGMPSPDAFKMLVYRLRKNLDSEKSQSLLHTVRGVGLSLRVN